MFIPIGLIARLAEEARDEAMLQSMQAEAHALDRERAYARAKSLWDACVGPDAALLVVGHNAWADCSIDGVRVLGAAPPAASPAPAGYRAAADDLGPGPHGFLGVPPGRHVIEARCDGRLAFGAIAAHPREAVFVRLDREAGTFVPYERAAENAILHRFESGALHLLHFTTAVAEGLVRDGRARTPHEAMNGCMPALRAVVAHLAAGDTDKAVGQAKVAAGALLGAALPTFEPITSFVGFHVFDLKSKGKAREAWLLANAGLSILPENPTLRAILGELELEAGNRDAAFVHLEAAVAREAGLDPRMMARARELLAARA